MGYKESWGKTKCEKKWHIYKLTVGHICNFWTSCKSIECETTSNLEGICRMGLRSEWALIAQLTNSDH